MVIWEHKMFAVENIGEKVLQEYAKQINVSN